MAVYKDKKRNTWYVNTSYTIDGKRFYKTKRNFTTKKAALEYEYQFKLSMDKPTTNSTTTFEELKNEFVRSKQANQETINSYKSLYDKYCNIFYDKPYLKITKSSLNDWRNYLASLDLNYKTKNKIISRFKAVCKYAYKIYDLKDISKSLDTFKKTYKDYTEMNVWTIEEFKSFIEYVKNPIYRAFFILLYNTGLRRGEALALQKNDISGNIISISKSIKHFQNGFNPTKNIASNRKIVLDTKTLSELKPLLKRPGSFIFGDYQSLGISSVQREFVKAIKLSGVKPIRIHDLRHSHATLLINNGVNIVAVSKRLGHTDINMTLKVYTHLLDKTNDELLKTLESL